MRTRSSETTTRDQFRPTIILNRSNFLSGFHKFDTFASCWRTRQRGANVNFLGFSMNLNLKKIWRATTALCVASTIVVTNVAYAAGPAPGADAAAKLATATPIKHVIVLIGENRGFDHTFGVYKPKGKGETISNLLSRGLVKEDGTPGPHYVGGQQYSV